MRNCFPGSREDEVTDSSTDSHQQFGAHSAQRHMAVSSRNPRDKNKLRIWRRKRKKESIWIVGTRRRGKLDKGMTLFFSVFGQWTPSLSIDISEAQNRCPSVVWVSLVFSFFLEPFELTTLSSHANNKLCTLLLARGKNGRFPHLSQNSPFLLGFKRNRHSTQIKMWIKVTINFDHWQKHHIQQIEKSLLSLQKKPPPLVPSIPPSLGEWIANRIDNSAFGWQCPERREWAMVKENKKNPKTHHGYVERQQNSTPHSSSESLHFFSF